ncbi:MAG TPA: LysR family transcriptional regulator substrate-binding protein [Planctomycetaceae bacterium]|nr:LysR family transcriptional regulator substrate-binding protein [Planctomycetaceae bacterium]HQZ65909.1 LysR family transcriptional regulator substrate-binding protein [Planctomycetaceae bacterium]HRA86772.1 LysR family transcriptional regulator substrate-binding protein [Planctomycetaceae bacterium]
MIIASAASDRQPWLLLKGKRWKLTAEGQRVRGVVADLVRRYEQMQQFVSGQQPAMQTVSLACGQQAATGFVKIAVERFLQERPDCRVRLSTPRGKSRIEGVAGGQFDMAIVTDSPATIHRIAGMELYIETLFNDRFVLVANPPAKAPWAMQWNALPTDRPVTAKELLGLPFILPEPDASRRKQFDEWIHKATGQFVDVILETGRWQAILDFAASGLGVGFVTESSIASHSSLAKGYQNSKPLDIRDFPTDAVRLIARKAHGVDSIELPLLASDLADTIRKSTDR